MQNSPTAIACLKAALNADEDGAAGCVRCCKVCVYVWGGGNGVGVVVVVDWEGLRVRCVVLCCVGGGWGDGDGGDCGGRLVVTAAECGGSVDLRV
jgi:hypothetical protein